MECRALRNNICLTPNNQIAPCYLFDTKYAKNLNDITVNEYREKHLLPLNEEMKKTGKLPKPCWKCKFSSHQGIEEINRQINQIDPDNKSNDLLMLDISLSNICNNACIMCNSSRSTMYKKHHEKGLFLFPEQEGQLRKEDTVQQIDKNAYIDLIENSKSVKNIYIKGGEPTFDPRVLSMLHDITDPSQTNIQLNTNVTSVSNEFLDRLFEFKSVKVSFSIDAYGKLNNALRYPSEWKDCINNVKRWLEYRRDVDVFDVSSVISIFNFFNYPKLSRLVYEEFKITPAINILQTPVYHDICRLPEKYFRLGLKEYYSHHQKKLNHYWEQKQLSIPELKINNGDFISMSEKWFNHRGFNIKLTENPMFF